MHTIHWPDWALLTLAWQAITCGRPATTAADRRWP